MTVPFYVPPEQLVKDRAEYARKGISRGRSIAALEYDNGILILAENPSGTLHKISEVYDRLAFAGAGRYNEFELLRVAGIRHADLRGYMYGRSDVQAKSLANAFAQTLGNIFTHEIKPYEVEILVAELGEPPAGNALFKILYDGTLTDEEGFCAIGGQWEPLTEALASGFDQDLSLTGAIELSVESFGTVSNDGVAGWEAAVLEQSGARRVFRRLSEAELGGS